MLYKNDLFYSSRGELCRLLNTNPATNQAWIVNLDNKLSWPEECQWTEISGLDSVSGKTLSGPGAARSLVSPASNAQTNRGERAWYRIVPLIEKVPDIFNSSSRGRLVKDRAKDIPCSAKSIYDNLREYWRGGQTKAALLGSYHRSGRTKIGPMTAGRGRPPKGSERSIYQLSEADIAHMKSEIEGYYLKDERRSILDAYNQLLEDHYTSADGNGKTWVLCYGDRPSRRQFEHYLRKHYKTETRLRARKGDKEFERNHRSKLGTVTDNCHGVGHVYEIDATIADVYLVSSDDPNKIIGKPTMYLLFDRKSRLIPGFYVGLENASYIGALQAILSLSIDKSELCRTYDVTYHPEDWPAHQVFPSEFHGDRGSEWLCKASNQISGDLQPTIANLPSLRPDWKPVVECGFNLLHQQIKDVTPAYDPPSNATKRRGKHYEKDACLTLNDFTKIIIEAILAHNRKASPTYPLSINELTEGIQPIPIDLWNHGIQSRSGHLSRYNEEQVRFALLPRGKAVVEDKGLKFEGCYYTCEEATRKGWFLRTDRSHRSKLDISYDPRLVDVIYIHDKVDSSNFFVARLTPRSSHYAGLSRAEVTYYESLRADARPAIEQSRLQTDHEFRKGVKPTVEAAKMRLKAAGPTPSRSARRADTKAARHEERKSERQNAAAPMAQPGTPPTQPSTSATVLNFRSKADESTSAPQSKSDTPIPAAALPLAQRMKLQRERMLNG
jgi:putative transposase